MKSKNVLCGLAMAVVLQLGMLAGSAQAQNLFVSDGSGNILEFTPGGAQSTFASELGYAGGLAFDSAGNLFGTYGGASGSIIEITPGGVQTTFASGLYGPEGLAFDGKGNLFVACYNGPIIEFTPGGAQSFFAGVPMIPVGLAFDSAGDLFVAIDSPHPNSSAIIELKPGGVFSVFANGLSGAAGLAFDSAGDLFVVSGGNIYEFTPGGVQSTFASGLSIPTGLAFDSSGNLFEADAGSGNIYEFTPGGVQSTFASGLNGPQQYLALAFQPVPKLAIILSGTNVILTWRTNTTAFTLQSTTNLVSPAIWNTNLPPPVVVNGQNAVTNPISGSQQFFRLQ
jgi:sugar lactone lactonase YvrE